MIRRLTLHDASSIEKVINIAALGDKGFIPEDCYQEPYMSRKELRDEMSRVTFFGWEEGEEVVAVAGLQPVANVTLIRHVYVLPEYQRRGLGSKLIHHLQTMTRTRRLLVGAWSGAAWAINFYRKLGFELLPNKNLLLDVYWQIPPRQREISVVLGMDMEQRQHENRRTGPAGGLHRAHKDTQEPEGVLCGGAPAGRTG
jgi:GNAT superfamily N-acetyltransferase